MQQLLSGLILRDIDVNNEPFSLPGYSCRLLNVEKLLTVVSEVFVQLQEVPPIIGIICCGIKA